jgi:hypothetical protein
MRASVLTVDEPQGRVASVASLSACDLLFGFAAFTKNEEPDAQAISQN